MRTHLAKDEREDHAHHVEGAQSAPEGRPPGRGGDLGHKDPGGGRSEAEREAAEDAAGVEEVDVGGEGGAEEAGQEEWADEAAGHPPAQILPCHGKSSGRPLIRGY